MSVPTTLADMLDAAFAEARRMRMRDLIYLLCLAVAWQAAGLLRWSLGPGLEPAWIGALIALAVAGVVVVFAISTTMIGVPPSARGLMRYLLTTLVLTAPIFLVVGLLLISARAGFDGAGFAALVAGLIGVVISAILTPWPLMQATSPRLVGPREAFRRTRGMRWSLVLTCYVIGTLDRLAPETTEADTVAEALFAAGLGVGVGLFGMVSMLALSVAAWKRMN